MTKRKSGVLLHPTSLPSPYGIGDLGHEAFAFVDFLKKAGQKIWQILPLGHTCFGDSPYQSFSAFAGNPLLISIDALAEDGLLDSDDLPSPSFPEDNVDYGRVIDYKYSVFRKAYEKFKRVRSRSVFESCGAFYEKNKFWLDDYCLFISLKNYFIEKRKNTWDSPEYKAYKKANKKTMSENMINDCFYGASWNSWPSDIAKRNKSAVEKWTKKLKNEIGFYKFLQFEFDKQWKNLRTYANDSGIEIIGDIPIFVAADSADTWAEPKLFEIDQKGYPISVAGVPPDYFSETGQAWGNPLYDWGVHKETGYDWWIKRIKKTLELVDSVRIDHFRAFESYWAIPYGSETAVNGKWIKGPGEDFFKVIEKNIPNLSIIAEDLGDLNEEVLVLRDKLGYPGMKILQFAFGGDPANAYLPHNYTNDNFVVYTGTHDNDTTIGWYNSIDDAEKDRIRRLLNVSGDDIAWDLIRYAFSSTAKIAVIPIQDILCLDTSARMNTPGVSGGNWQFRFRKSALTDEKARGLAYLSNLYNR